MTVASDRSFTGTAAENYERYFVPAIGTPVSTILLDAAALRPGERVLDVACGTGVIARLAAARLGPAPRVTGLDVSADMIEVARASSPETIEWHVGDAMSLPFPDNAFDVVLCQMGLMFMEDRSTAVKEMQRVLVPGGRVIVSTPGAIQRPFALMEEAIVEHIGADLGAFVRAVFSMHDPNAVAALLRGADLVDVGASVATVTLELPSPAEFLWQYVNLTPMAPFVAAAPEAAQAAMERHVVETWKPFVVGGTTRVRQPMVVASGRK
jgi:SAM-dependent methyltransferase